MLPELETERLILRQWRDSDAGAFAAMNADPEVMRYFPKLLTQAKSDAMLGRVREKWRREGFSFAAVEVKGAGFIGFAAYGTLVDYRGVGQEGYGRLSLAERGDFWGGYVSAGASFAGREGQ